MPEQEHSRYYRFLNKKEYLSFDEIFHLTKLFVQLGVTKVRITGGEPLLRPNTVKLIKNLKEINEIKDLALTTNGSLLAKHAESLERAGLKRLTVSLDTLDPQVFKIMNGKKGSLQEVLNAIDTASQLSFDPIKINVVVQKGINDHTILDLVKYFRWKKPILRFIEYMDVGNCNHWQSKHVVPAIEIVDMIHRHFPIKPLKSNYFGEVASRYQFLDGSGEVGFIAAVTQPFCSSCTRMRLSADGKIYTCLFSHQGIDLRTPLREGATDEQLINIIKKVWTDREDRYSELRSKIVSYTPRPAMTQIPQRLEMFQIGG